MDYTHRDISEISDVCRVLCGEDAGYQTVYYDWLPHMSDMWSQVVTQEYHSLQDCISYQQAARALMARHPEVVIAQQTELDTLAVRAVAVWLARAADALAQGWNAVDAVYGSRAAIHEWIEVAMTLPRARNAGEAKRIGIEYHEHQQRLVRGW
jgi:hypothetical protein